MVQAKLAEQKLGIFLSFQKQIVSLVILILPDFIFSKLLNAI